MRKIKAKKTPEKIGFFDLSSGEQKKIVKEAARRANRDQMKLVKEYDGKFGDLQTNTCK